MPLGRHRGTSGCSAHRERLQLVPIKVTDNLMGSNWDSGIRGVRGSSWIRGISELEKYLGTGD